MLRKRTGACRRRHMRLKKTPTLNVQVGSKEALPHKKRTTVSWPRRGCRGLHRHRGAFSPARVDRVPLVKGTGAATAPEPKAPAGSSGYTEHDYVDGVYDGTNSLQGKVH